MKLLNSTLLWTSSLCFHPASVTVHWFPVIPEVFRCKEKENSMDSCAQISIVLNSFKTMYSFVPLLDTMISLPNTLDVFKYQSRVLETPSLLTLIKELMEILSKGRHVHGYLVLAWYICLQLMGLDDVLPSWRRSLAGRWYVDFCFYLHSKSRIDLQFFLTLLALHIPTLKRLVTTAANQLKIHSCLPFSLTHKHAFPISAC